MKPETAGLSCATQRGGNDYRGRIYGKYVSKSSESPAPVAVQGFAPRAAQLGKAIRLYFPRDRNASIVDLGCGHGALIHFAREAGYRNISGIDCSPEQVETARRLGIHGVCQADLLEAISSMADRSLDAVLAFDVIEHLRKEELTGFADDVLRVLRCSGRLIIHAPNAESPFGSRMLYGDLTHEMAFTRESLCQLLLCSGFESVSCYEDGPVPHGLKSGIRWVLWKGLRTIVRAWVAIETGDPARDGIFTRNLFAVAHKQAGNLKIRI